MGGQLGGDDGAVMQPATDLRHEEGVLGGAVELALQLSRQLVDGSDERPVSGRRRPERVGVLGPATVTPEQLCERGRHPGSAGRAEADRSTGGVGDAGGHTTGEKAPLMCPQPRSSWR